MPDIPKIVFGTEEIPTELKQRRQWVCWRYEVRDGELQKIAS